LKRKRKIFTNASGMPRLTHIERVYKLADETSPPGGADLKILAAACFVHDIGRRGEMRSCGKKNISHEEKRRRTGGKIFLT